MNIGIDIRPLITKNRTGVGEYTFELINAIFKIDKNNQYFLFYNSYKNISANIPKWEQNNIHFVATHYPNKLFNTCIKFLQYPKLDKIMRVKLDVFFSPNLNFTAVSTGTKFILTVHDLSFILFPEYFSLKQRLWHKFIDPKKQFKRADVILVPSENTKRDIIDYCKINSDKIQVMYPGLSSVFTAITEEEKLITRKKYNLPQNFILFLGTVEERKNIIGLIKAFEKSRPHLPTDVYLIIAGAPGQNYQQIYQYAQNSPYKEKIKFIDFIPSENKPALYALAALFVYPSFYEGFGFPVLEAMTSKIPVITSNRASLIEITDSAEYLVNPNSPNQIAEGIIKILNSPELQKQQIKNGLAEAEKFSWQKTAEQFLTLFHN